MARILASIALLLPCAVVAPTSPPPAVTRPRVHGNAASTSGPGRARAAEAHRPAAGAVGKVTGRATVTRPGTKSASSPAVTSETRVASPTPRRSPAARVTRSLTRPPLAEESRWSTSERPGVNVSGTRSTPGTSSDTPRPLATGSSATSAQTDLERARTLPEPWRSIVRCESLGDGSWRVLSSSVARGWFQFMRSTWRSLGLRGDPAAAPFSVQYFAARQLARRDGLRAWDCARILGLA